MKYNKKVEKKKMNIEISFLWKNRENQKFIEEESGKNLYFNNISTMHQKEKGIQVNDILHAKNKGISFTNYKLLSNNNSHYYYNSHYFTGRIKEFIIDDFFNKILFFYKFCNYN